MLMLGFAGAPPRSSALYGLTSILTGLHPCEPGGRTVENQGSQLWWSLQPPREGAVEPRPALLKEGT